MLNLECKEQHLLVLKKDESLVQSLTQFAKTHKLKGGRIHGIGALKDVELGFYNLHEKVYVRRTFTEGDFELISLHGNITEREGEPYVHVHASLGREDFSVFGGHLFEAKVAVTVEVFIEPLGKMPRREHDSEIGLHLICGFSQGSER